jgi:hypothetical protein
MRKLLVSAALLAALSVPFDAQANGNTWTMPYTGSCNIFGDSCIHVDSVDIALGGVADNVGVWGTGTATTGIGVHGQSTNGTGVRGLSTGGVGVKGQSTNSYGVDASGFVAVRGVGVIGLQGSGFSFGLETSGGTAPINLTGTIPANPQNPLCKSTAGNTAGHIGTCGSTRALKENIQELTMGTETLMKLRPVTFQWKSNHSADLGFVAEDVAKVNRLLAVYNEGGQIQSVKYTQMTALLTKVLQEQVRERKKVEDGLRQQVSDLGTRNADLTKELQQLRQQNAALTHQQRELQTSQRELQNLLKGLAARLGAVEDHTAASK